MMESYLLAILVSMVLITIINIILNKKRASGKIKGKHYLFDIFIFISCYFIKRYSWVPTLSDLEKKSNVRCTYI